MAFLSPHFSEAEFVRSQTAARRGIRNRFTARTRRSAVALCENILEPLRFILGAPVSISSGLRVKLLNAVIGGASTSQHIRGEAADIGSNALSDPEIFDLIRLFDLPFDQIIEEFGRWVHVSHGPRHRRQALVARFRQGRAVYSPARRPKYTDAMREVVTSFQARVGLEADGVIGPNTRAAATRWLNHV